jgi:phosphatidylglycerol lysyltransferase
MLTEPDLASTRALVMRYGWNATSYQIVNPGITKWFSRAGDAVIGYVKKSGVRVVAGAPICSLANLEETIEEWETDSNGAGNRICYFGAAGRIEEVLKDKPGYSTVVLGAQPVWDPAHWAGIIGKNASLRAQLSRAKNKGVAVEEWGAERAQNHPDLQRILEEWLHTRGLPPLHFLVEPQTLAMLKDRRVFVAVQAGKPVGFTVLSPVPKRNGWLTEQFPRGKDAPNGTVELLLDAAARTVAAEGASYLTMGLVPLSIRVDQTAETPWWLKLLLRWVRAHGRRFYNFGGLEWFKAKFEPDYWEPIYAISKESRFSFRSLYAIAAAFSDGPPLFAVLRGLGKAVRQEARWIGRSIRTKR